MFGSHIVWSVGPQNWHKFNVRKYIQTLSIHFNVLSKEKSAVQFVDNFAKDKFVSL